jgi:hypothetical protein
MDDAKATDILDDVMIEVVDPEGDPMPFIDINNHC